MPLLLLALIAAPVQVPAAASRETAFGYTFSMPAGWNRQELANGSIVLTPPNVDSRAFSFAFLPSRSNTLSADAAHEQLFRGMAQAGQVAGQVRRFETSGWQCSETSVAAPQGQRMGMGVCSTTANRRLDAVMWTTMSDAMLETWHPTVERLVGSIEQPGQPTAPPTVTSSAAPTASGSATPAPRGTAIHGLVIPYPSTWARQDDPSGAVTLVPPQIAGVRQYSISVLPPTPISGTHWETHRTLVRAIRQQVQWAGEPVVTEYASAPGPFIRTEIAGFVPGGGIYQVQLYTAAHDGTVESAVGLNTIDRNVVEPVLEATTFVRAATTDRPRIAEAYRRMDQRTFVDASGGAPIAGSLQYERIWLWAGGVADFSTSYPAGYAASPEPLKVDVGLMSGDYGRWQSAGDEVRITRREGAAPVVYRREDGGLREGGAFWEPMARVDGLELSGRYALRSRPGDAVPYYWWVEFTPDGRFTTDGLLRVASAGDGRQPPERGSGTYEIRDWTIFFRFDDGFVWSTDFSILGRDLTDFTSIILQTSAYPRER